MHTDYSTGNSHHYSPPLLSVYGVETLASHKNAPHTNSLPQCKCCSVRSRKQKIFPSVLSVKLVPHQCVSLPHSSITSIVLLFAGPLKPSLFLVSLTSSAVTSGRCICSSWSWPGWKRQWRAGSLTTHLGFLAPHVCIKSPQQQRKCHVVLKSCLTWDMLIE